MPSDSLFTRRAVLSAATGAAALAALSACAGSPPAPSATPTPSGQNASTASLDAVFEKAFAASGMAGVAARVRLPDGSLWQKNLGYSDLAAKTPYDSADFVRIASISKTFTATAVLTMVDDGMLALTDTLDRWYPSIPNAASITLEQMLGMRSGIFDFTSETQFDDAFDASPTMPWSIEQTLEVILRNQPAFAPGAQVSYCDSNYALLGAIASQVDGRPLGDVIQARVIAGGGAGRHVLPDGCEHPLTAPAGVRSDGAGRRELRHVGDAAHRRRGESRRSRGCRGSHLDARRRLGVGRRARRGHSAHAHRPRPRGWRRGSSRARS